MVAYATPTDDQILLANDEQLYAWMLGLPARDVFEKMVRRHVVNEYIKRVETRKYLEAMV